MKIALFDPYRPKFTQDMVKWWQDQGHEVREDRYYDPELVVWADVVWYETCDNNLLSATNPNDAIQGTKFEEYKGKDIPWDMHELDLSNKTIVVRPIDIEVWQGHHAHENMWDIVDHVIFLNTTMRDYMMTDSRPRNALKDEQIHIIQCGLDLNRWTFKQREAGFKIGVVGELWMSKGVDYALQIAVKLKAIDERYEIHWLGKNQMYHWEYEYCLDFIKRNKLNFTIYHESVESVDEWLEDKNYLLSSSKKEAFGYNIAEAMAKGIKPVIHHFYGAEHVWPGFTWNTIDEAVHEIVYGDYQSEEYLKYLIDHGYTIDQMMEKVMEAISDK